MNLELFVFSEMDYLSHGVWSYNLFYRCKHPLYAVFFGLLPDNASWVIYFFYRLFTGHLRPGRPIVDQIPGWMWTLYGISHSLVVCAGVLLLVFLVLRRIPVYMLAWPIAIIADVFTHSREFLPTPFLWPVSDWKFPGFSWASPWFMILNAMVMTSVFVWIRVKKRREKTARTQ